MAKGKSQYTAWYCSECGRANYVTAYNKKSNDKIKKELSKFCKQSKTRTVHKRKDLKKAAK
ncbi:MAG: 50S ribosomal protein L33 [Candidatus Gracilibacteria bacterium]